MPENSDALAAYKEVALTIRTRLVQELENAEPPLQEEKAEQLLAYDKLMEKISGHLLAPLQQFVLLVSENTLKDTAYLQAGERAQILAALQPLIPDNSSVAALLAGREAAQKP